MTITPISLYTPQTQRNLQTLTAKVADFIRKNWALLTIATFVFGVAGYLLYSNYMASRIIVMPPSSQKFENLYSNITQSEMQQAIDFLKGKSLTAPQSFLLTGSGFSGKSHIARAVSHAANVPIIQIDCKSNLDNLKNKIANAFAAAKSQAGCVILIQHAEVLKTEIDIEKGQLSIKRPPALTQLQKDLSELGKLAKVAVFVTAKNETSDLGNIHFDDKFVVALPDSANRLNILTALTKGITCEADLKKWARKTSGWNYAQLLHFVGSVDGKITDDALDKLYVERQKMVDGQFKSSLKSLNDLGPGEFLTKSKYCFDDIAGNSDAKEKMQEVADYLQNPEKYQKILKEPSNELAPKGVILHGEPGTGKTALAGALASQADCPFLYIKGSMASKWVGDCAKNMRNLFAQARATNRPCIIFMDEIDSIGKRTDDMTGSASSAREMITAFTSETDGLTDWPHPIVVIGATNRLDTLDDAFTRPGRFDRVIEVKLPTKKESLEILKIHAAKYHLDKDFKLSSIASLAYGRPGAWLKELLKDAAREAINEGKDKIADAHLFEAFEKRCMGAKTTEEQAKEKIERVAAHEIGHALVAAKHGKTVQAVTVRPRGEAAGLTYSTYDTDKMLTKELCEKEIQICLGGQAAEEIMYNDHAAGCKSDRDRAKKIIESMILQYGYGKRNSPYPEKLSEFLRKAVEEEIEEVFNTQLANAKAIITKDLIESIRPALVQEEILTADKFKQLLPKDFLQTASPSRPRAQTQ